MALETATSRTLAAPVNVAAPFTAPVAPAPVAPVHVPGPSTAQSQTPSAHVTSVTAAAGALVVPGSRPLAKAPAEPAVPGSRPLAKAPAAPAVPGPRPLAKAPAKPPTKTVVAAKADKKEEAAGAAAKKSGVVESVEKRKRGRPRKQPLNDTTNEVVAVANPTSAPNATFTTPALEPANPPTLEAEKAAKEKEAADAAAKQAAKGWFEKTTRIRKPTRLSDGSLPTREVKGTRAKKPAPLDSVEEALLARAKTGSKRKSAAPITRPKKKRKA
ncbi:hypothetical protein B0H14DRAFT_3458793 [Mycena olivaceomarginata]|nr:hypothetical protein B0H14DRAFT_3458793 [Mycena olivaceomarginata]